jgi:hypothetical protein
VVEMDRGCSTYWKDYKCMQDCSSIPTGKNDFEDVGLDEGKILKWIIKK